MSSINGNSPRLCIDHLSPEVEAKIERYFKTKESQEKIERTKQQLFDCVNKIYERLATNPSATFEETDFTDMPLERTVVLVKAQLEQSGKIDKEIKTSIQFKTMGDTSVAYRVCRVTFGK